MATLPFVIPPRLTPVLEEIGTPESGTLLIERRGYLTAGEKNMVQGFIQADESAVDMISMARDIAKTFDIGLDKAYGYLTEVIGGSAYSNKKICTQIQENFYEKIEGLMTSLARSQSKTEMVQAIALITSRIDKNFPVEDISTVHPDIIAQLSELYQDEEKKSIEKLEKAMGTKAEPTTVEEIEKKP